MDQLSALDAGFLQAEDSDPHISLAIGGVSVLDGPVPDFDDITAELTERLKKIPRMRQVLHTHPLDLGAPEWQDRPDLDLSHHFRHTALPAPGDDAALFRLTADIIERRLDREHPLWECWIVEGLAEDRWAIVVKIHHCLADGISAARIMAGLTDSGSGDTFATDIDGAKPAGAGRSLQLSLNPLAWGRAAAQAAQGAVSIVSGLLQPATGSSLHGRLSASRRYHAAQVSLDDVRAICDAFDVTLNDVALSAITQGYRDVLLSRGETPDRNSLRTLVPVSVRSNDALDTPDNRVSIMLPLLPVNRANPLDQLRTVHRRMQRAKSGGQRQAASSVLNAGALIPFPVTAWAVRGLTRLPQRGVVALATNVPGPRQTVTVLGQKVIRMFPIPPIALQLRTGIGMLSYDHSLTFGITADYDSAPDLDVLTGGIERAVARLAELAAKR